jgi:hypothetical protein
MGISDAIPTAARAPRRTPKRSVRPDPAGIAANEKGKNAPSAGMIMAHLDRWLFDRAAQTTRPKSRVVRANIVHNAAPAINPRM